MSGRRVKQKTQVEIYLFSMFKLKYQIRNFLISQELFYLTQVTRKNFGGFTISMPYGSPAELRIDCVEMFITSYVMEQYFSTKISKYGV